MIIDPEMKSIIGRMKTAIHAYNKSFTDEFIDNLSVSQMLSYCHPLDRADFENEIDRHNRKKEKEFKKQMNDD